MAMRTYNAVVSSDWNQCLAPCGPFDPIVYSYPEQASALTAIFEDYTGNRIPLGTANERIQARIPNGISPDRMDAYLDDCFTTYKGVPALIEWCRENRILFMINTTGYIGYFQRVFARQLLPGVPVLSANTMIRYPKSDTDPEIYDLSEISDKGRNTARALDAFGIPENKVVIIGDSGGDGPHFSWGHAAGAYLVGSMAKASLTSWCAAEKIAIDRFLGHRYGPGEKRQDNLEMQTDFMELVPLLAHIVALSE